MSDALKMTTERLVDVFEQMLSVALEMTCNRKKGVYANCIRRMLDEKLSLDEMNPARMCLPCRALWHLQQGKKAWVEVAQKLNPGWDPVQAIPPEQRFSGSLPSAGTKVVDGSGDGKN